MDQKLEEIKKYVMENYEKLPESCFELEGKCIIVYVKTDEEDIGGHYFEGLGITKEGIVKWFFSSGCSCSGGPSSEDATLKSFEVKKSPYTDISNYWEKNKDNLESFEFCGY
jgi:hypothetical protein|tara:strand:- start:30579 stop:30914 length:336 start_codon:yes stop_codon:yes gene_type:complete